MDIVCGVHGKCQVVIQSFLVFGQILGQCVFSQGNKRKLSSVGSARPSRITAPIKSFTSPGISILYYGHKVVNHRKEVITLTVIPRCLPM